MRPVAEVGEDECLAAEAVFQAAGDRAENARYLVAEDRQDADNDNSNQNKDQCVLDQALAFFTSEKIAKHVRYPFENEVEEQ